MRSFPLLLGAIGTIAALAPVGPLRAQAPGLGVEASVSGLVFDNFFQASDPALEETVTAAAVDLRAGPRWASVPVWIYGRAAATAYEGLDTSVLVGGGVLAEGRRHALDLQLSRETDRPTLDVGDGVEPAEVMRVAGAYGFRVTEDWEVKAAGGYEDHQFEISEGQSGASRMVGGGLRWRGWGYAFSPEVGLAAGGRDAEDDEEDYDQRELYVQVRSVPVQRLYLSGRWRLRGRDYTTGLAASDNRGREDTRHQWVVLADLRLTDLLSGFGYWSLESADSTLETRQFSAQYLILGVRARW